MKEKTATTEPILAELAAHMDILATKIQKLDAERSELYKQWDMLRKVTIPELMEQQHLDKASIEGVGTLSLRTDAYCSVPAEQKENLCNWLRENKFDDLISTSINSSSLKAFIKEQFKAGNPIPPSDIVNFQPYTFVAIVNKKG